MAHATSVSKLNVFVLLIPDIVRSPSIAWAYVKRALASGLTMACRSPDRLLVFREKLVCDVVVRPNGRNPLPAGTGVVVSEKTSIADVSSIRPCHEIDLATFVLPRLGRRSVIPHTP